MFKTVECVARKTGIPEDVIHAYVSHGWLAIVENNGTTFLPAHQEYKLKFVHHLSTKMRLNEREVTTILRVDSPPYSLAKVPSILAEHCARPDRSGGHPAREQRSRESS